MKTIVLFFFITLLSGSVLGANLVKHTRVLRDIRSINKGKAYELLLPPLWSNTRPMTGKATVELRFPIIELISRRKALVFGDIIEALALPPASASRILKLLCQCGYLLKDVESGVYHMGTAMQSLMPEKSTSQRLQEVASSTLVNLRDQTSQTAILFYWNGQSWECIGKELHENSITMQQVGETRIDIFEYPWSCFAYKQLNKEKRQAVNGLNPENKKHLEKCLLEYKKRAFVMDSTKHLHRLTVAIKDKEESLIGALALGVSPFAMENSGQEYFSQLLINAGKQIEELF